MVQRRKSTCMNVDSEFFDKLFEPARKKTMKQLGLSKLGQKDFSRMLYKGGVNLNVKLNSPTLTNRRKSNVKRKK